MQDTNETDFAPQPTEPPTPQPPRREMASFGRSLPLTTAVLAILLALVLVPYLVRSISEAIETGRERARVKVAIENREDIPLQDVSYRFRDLVTGIAPSVVHINTIIKQTRSGLDGFPFSRGPQETTQRVGQGSGVIVDPAGYIVTNEHVVRGAKTYQVTLSDQSVHEAKLIGKDGPTDLAVLKISAGNLTALEWEPDDSRAFDPGSLVWALGSPFGLDHSVTMGIISARSRHSYSDDGQPNPYQDFLQHDAAVNPGNSGGPLVGPRGRVIGINTLIVSKSGGYQGVSFAIPSTIAREVYERIRAEGKYSHGHVGVAISDVNKRLHQHLNLTSDAGAVVERVMPNSPAELAGVKIGDVFVEWNGNTVNDVYKFRQLVGRTKPGTEVDAVVQRDGQRVNLRILVGERPSEL